MSRGSPSINGAAVEPTTERELPTLDHVHALADAIRPQFRAFVLLAAFGGLRRGELLALTRREIDLLHRTVEVRLQGATTKELMHRLGHASPAAALRYRHATAKRDEAVADGIDRLLEAAKDEPAQRRSAVRTAGSEDAE